MKEILVREKAQKVGEGGTVIKEDAELLTCSSGNRQRCIDEALLLRSKKVAQLGIHVSSCHSGLLFTFLQAHPCSTPEENLV